MTVDERGRLYRWAVAAAGPRPVYAGVAAVRTRDAVTLARSAAAAGAAGLMVGFPPYVRLGGPDALAYLAAVTGATDLPVLVYNNPLRTAFDLTPELLEAAASAHPSIRAVKEAGDPGRAQEIRRRLGPDFGVFSGSDRNVAAHFAQGYTGLTSIAGNLWPAEMGRIVADLAAGRPAEAEAALGTLGPRIAVIVETQLPASLKHALRLAGRPGGWCREPLGHLTPEAEAAIALALKP